MDQQQGYPPLKDQLSLSNQDVWLIVAERILPRVRRELQRRFGIERRWVSVEDAALSACRTVFRRLKSGQAASYPLQTLDDLEVLLFAIAHRKLVDAIRATTRESRHAPRVAELRNDVAVAAAVAANADQIRDRLIEMLERLLETDVERTIFREKMSGATESAIAETLRKASGVPWSKYMVREAWRRFRRRVRRQVEILFRLVNDPA